MRLRWIFVLGAVALLLVGATVATIFVVRASSPERVAEELSKRLEMQVEIHGDVGFSFRTSRGLANARRGPRACAQSAMPNRRRRRATHPRL